VSPNGCNTKLANSGDDRGLSDIQIILKNSWVSDTTLFCA